MTTHVPAESPSPGTLRPVAPFSTEVPTAWPVATEPPLPVAEVDATPDVDPMAVTTPDPAARTDAKPGRVLVDTEPATASPEPVAEPVETTNDEPWDETADEPEVAPVVTRPVCP